MNPRFLQSEEAREPLSATTQLHHLPPKSTACANTSWVEASSVSQVQTPPFQQHHPCLGLTWWVNSQKLALYNHPSKLFNSPAPETSDTWSTLPALQGLHMPKNRLRTPEDLSRPSPGPAKSVWVIPSQGKLKFYTPRPLLTLRCHHLKAGPSFHSSLTIVWFWLHWVNKRQRQHVSTAEKLVGLGLPFKTCEICCFTVLQSCTYTKIISKIHINKEKSDSGLALHCYQLLSSLPAYGASLMGELDIKQLVSEPQLAVIPATHDYFQLYLLKACTPRNILLRHWKQILLFTIYFF